jgi:hypothetical protein
MGCANRRSAALDRDALYCRALLMLHHAVTPFVHVMTSRKHHRMPCGFRGLVAGLRRIGLVYQYLDIIGASLKY